MEVVHHIPIHHEHSSAIQSFRFPVAVKAGSLEAERGGLEEIERPTSSVASEHHGVQLRKQVTRGPRVDSAYAEFDEPHDADGLDGKHATKRWSSSISSAKWRSRRQVESYSSMISDEEEEEEVESSEAASSIGTRTKASSGLHKTFTRKLRHQSPFEMHQIHAPEVRGPTVEFPVLETPFDTASINEEEEPQTAEPRDNGPPPLPYAKAEGLTSTERKWHNQTVTKPKSKFARRIRDKVHQWTENVRRAWRIEYDPKVMELAHEQGVYYPYF